MLRLPIQSIQNLHGDINTYGTINEDPDYFLFQYEYMTSSNRSDSNFFCVFLINIERSNNKENDQSVFLIDMYSINLIGEYTLDFHYRWIDSFIDGKIIIGEYDIPQDYTETILTDSEQNLPVSIDKFKDIDSYHKYINYMNILCDKLSLVNKLKIITNESLRVISLIERCYGKKSEELLKLNKLYLQIKNEVEDLKQNYPKETLWLIK